MHIETVKLGRSIYQEAFSTNSFIANINEGYERVVTLEAESGFAVFRDRQQVLVSELVYGGKVPNEVEEAYGMRGTVPELIGEEDSRFLHSFKYEKGYEPTLIADFHFHPWHGSASQRFSQADIDFYEGLVYASAEVGNVDRQLIFGVFTEPFYHPRDFGLGVLAFQGPFENNIYQAANFNQLNTKQQVEILTESGFRVAQLDLTNGNGKFTNRSLSKIPAALSS